MCSRTKQVMRGGGAAAVALIMLFTLNLSTLSAAVPQQGGSTKAVKKMRVVTSIQPLLFFVKKVGGEHVDVKVMVPPGANPHSYDPTPGQMIALGKAQLFVKAGSGIEFELDWMNKFSALNPDMEVCNASQGAGLIEMPAKRHDHGHEHRHERLDPHFWLSPQNGILIAKNVERSFAKIDPSHAGEYEENRRKLELQLKALSKEIAKKLSGLKNRVFMVFHPAWGYYANEFNLVQIAAEEEGKELTPKKMQRIIGQAREHGIKVVFVSPSFSTFQAETIAREIGGVTQPVDPLSGNYIGNLRRATDAFVTSMQ